MGIIEIKINNFPIYEIFISVALLVGFSIQSKLDEIL